MALVPVQEGWLLVYTNPTWTEKTTGLFSFLKQRVGYNIIMHEMEQVMKSSNISEEKIK